MLHEALTEQIIGAFYKVYNTLGYGFLEKVYENALALELRRQGLDVKQQHPISVHYERELVGEYFADLLVENKVILELKSVETIHEKHLAQLMNYLKATRIEVGFIMNFGPKASFKRKILTNNKKSNLKKSA